MSIARTCSYFRIVFLALTIPALALPAAGSVTSVILNGPTVGANSGYSPISFNQNVTLSDGDVYDVFGSYYATYSDAEGTAIHFNPTVVYEGTSPSVANDNISFIFTQQFFDSRPGTWDGTYSASTPVNFFGLVGADSSVTAEVFYDGQSLGSGTTTTSSTLVHNLVLARVHRLFRSQPKLCHWAWAWLRCYGLAARNLRKSHHRRLAQSRGSEWRLVTQAL